MKNLRSFFAAMFLYFMVSQAMAQSVIISPAGGEHFAAGSLQRIAWDTKLVTGNLSLTLWDGEHGKWLPIASNISAAEGSAKWSVPYQLRGSKFRIKLAASEGIKGNALMNT